MKTVALAMTDRDERTDVVRTIAAFMRGYSLEATRPNADDVAALGGIVPAGTQRLCQRGAGAARRTRRSSRRSRLRRGGFEPVPHLAVRTSPAPARSIASWRGSPARRACGSCW